MNKFCLFRLASVVFLSLSFSGLIWAQIYTPPPSTPTTTTTTTTTTPAPTTTGTAPVATTTTTAFPTTTTGITATPVTSAIPGYTAQGNYGPGRTIAYVIAPFAVVGATYLLGHHQVEIHPNAGFVWPGSVDFSDTMARLRDEGIYGLKTGVFLNDHVELEGSFSYMNHFESRLVPTGLDHSFGIAPQTVHGLLYDVNGIWNFGKQQILGSKISPYVVGGIGGLSTLVPDANSALIGGEFYRTDPATGAAVLDPTRTVVVHNNTAFFAVNYGGGIKAANLWGPIGLRADIRGRTFPNFRGESLTWPEATAGLTFTFGER
jgi:hypothetical protein